MEIPVIAINIVKNAKQRQVGACVIRRINRTGSDDQVFYAMELYDFLEENDSFANLDSFLIQVGSGKFYFPDELENSSKGDGRKLANLLHGKELEVIFTKRSNYGKKSGLEEKILKLTGKSTHATTIAEFERPLAYGCIECLLQSLRLLDDDSNEGHFDLRLGSLNTAMRLDSAAAEAVNLLPRADHPSQFGSIFGVLNRCKTKMGSRLLDRWLRQPLRSKDEINARLDCVSILKDSTLHRNQLLDGALKGIPDIDVVLTKMQKRNSGLEEMFRLYVFSLALPAMCSILSDMVAMYPSLHTDSTEAANDSLLSVESKLLKPLQAVADKFALYQQLVCHVIDMDQLPNLQVNSQHSEELAELKEERQTLEAAAEKLLQRARGDWASFADVKLETSPQHGLYFRSTKCDDERQLRAQNKNVRILSMQKNGVHFTTPELEKIADRIQSIDSEYGVLQKDIVDKALETALTYVPIAESASSLVAEVDVLVSFATCAALAPGSYVRPTVLDQGTGVIDLKAARHPCVELMDNMQFIPNDYDLIAGKSNFQIVTGPNMGGKSTYIRAVGCIMVMAQVGSFVPCTEATVSIVDAVLARVGAGDAVQKGVSTFMAEMLEASVILQTATKDSLIIIDELGRGTSTFDGFGLAWAISEFICSRIQCACLFATHFHELTALAHSKAEHGVVNKHVTAIAQHGQLVMLYSVQPGPCEESFGVHIASLAGFPGSVISEAKRKADELETLDHDSPAEVAKLARVESTLKAFTALPVEQLSAAELRPHLQIMFPPFETV